MILAFAGPCAPYNVNADVQCGSNAVNVSWQGSAGASSYTVQAYLQGQTTPSASCQSSNTTCTLTQLHCGMMFNVTVLASDDNCYSNTWAGTTFRTGTKRDRPDEGSFRGTEDRDNKERTVERSRDCRLPKGSDATIYKRCTRFFM